ncbi:MAG: ROK family protein [Eubacteriales bacterium]
MSKNYLGIDIGGTAVKIGLVSEDGLVISSTTASVSFDHYKTPIIHTVLKECDHYLQAMDVSPKDLLGIGVSATGQIDIHKGIVAGSAGHIDNWLGTPIVTTLSQHFHLPVQVANDANCAIMGEQWTGAAKACKDVLMITIGTGVGGGIIMNNELLSGSRGIAGELGHFTIHKNGAPCPCGNIGCYEQYASTTALVRKARTSLSLGNYEIKEDYVNGVWIFEQVTKGDCLMTTLMEEWMDDIAIGLIGLVHIFNPSLILIGGGVSKQEELFIQPLARKVFQGVMPEFCSNLKIQAAILGNDAGLLGAVYNFRKITQNS